MTQAYIYDAVRTPRGRGKADGALHATTPLTLAKHVLEAIRDRNALDTNYVDDVVLGCVSPLREQGANIARSAVLAADFAQTTAGMQVNRFCASGLEACNIAAAKIMAGEADLAIGGGVEAMSRVPMGSDGGALMSDPSLTFKIPFVPQGIGADMVATLYGFDRDDVDAFAVESQKRAARAWSEGRFSRSVVPLKDRLGLPLLDTDEFMRPETTLESLAKLKPSFAELGKLGFDDAMLQVYPQVERIRHVHHAGNSSGIVDGAAAVLFGSKEAGDAAGLKPRARVRAMASIGSEPSIMLTGPEFVSSKALKRAGMATGDIDLYELNEAFASVVLRFQQAFQLDPAILNANGGAIAMGHPLGATGAMILGTVLDELERTDKATALITLCVGGGMGTATIIERI